MGFIYVARYPSSPNTVKIGMSERSPFDRVDEWSRETGAPEKAEVLAAFPVIDPRRIETQLHAEFRSFATSGGGREWFRVDPSTAVKRIKEIIDSSERDFLSKALIKRTSPAEDVGTRLEDSDGDHRLLRICAPDFIALGLLSDNSSGRVTVAQDYEHPADTLKSQGLDVPNPLEIGCDRGAPLIPLDVSGERYEIFSPVEGVLQAVYVQAGDEVKEGDLLATLKPGPFAKLTSQMIQQWQQEQINKSEEMSSRFSLFLKTLIWVIGAFLLFTVFAGML